MIPGTLYLVPAPLDFGCASAGPLDAVLPHQTLLVAARLQHWVCENAKSTRAYLKRVGDCVPLAAPIQTLHIQELPRQAHKAGDHNPAAQTFDAQALLTAALPGHGGHDIGLVSEAGMPAIADPGSSVVRAAHELGLPVVPLVGPVSLMLALAASGLNGQSFAFTGYLPQEATARVQRIQALESLALKTGQAQLFIETPYRNNVLLQALVQTLQHNTRLAVCSGLTLAAASVKSQSVKAWRQAPAVLDNAMPAVFLLGR
jgi:16S rRNA (cytidine1402-2'-O)-methyltransferase